jgi:hypothetical protein
LRKEPHLDYWHYIVFPTFWWVFIISNSNDTIYVTVIKSIQGGSYHIRRKIEATLLINNPNCSWNIETDLIIDRNDHMGNISAAYHISDSSARQQYLCGYHRAICRQFCYYFHARDSSKEVGDKCEADCY